MNAAVEVNGLFVRYPGAPRNVLNGVSLSLYPGEVLALAGLSGCGKTTLCHCILGIIPRLVKAGVKGGIRIFSRDVHTLTVAERAQKIGIVFQEPDDQLFSPTIEDEVAFGPENLCIPREETGKRIEEALETVGMSRFRHGNPAKLSGGQKQLIALASVLALRPEILVFDEALSQIDADGRRLVKDAILRLKSEGKAILMVEHDFENMDIADRVLVLRGGKAHPYEGVL